MTEAHQAVDVIVVGGGNAAMCAALSAHQQGANVAVLEAAPRAERGGNSTYTAGAFRVVYEGVDDLLELMPGLTDDEIGNTEFGAYSAVDFMADMGRVTQYRADPDLTEILVNGSFETLCWMREQGIRFLPMYQRQAFKTEEGNFRFWGGLTVEVNGGGPGLIESLYGTAKRVGIDVRYNTRARQLVTDGDRVVGVRVGSADDDVVFGRSVVLASGGFEANAEWRARYLGPDWDLARVRGTRHNMGDGIRMALELSAEPYGHWSGSHAVAWDRNAPLYGDLSVGDGFQKHSYPFGILVNAEGRRFLDEGADFRNYTYAKYGREILRQTGQVAWQVFDSKVSHLLRDEYRIREATRARGDSLEELADRMDGIDANRFVETVRDFNAAVDTDVSFDPTVKDARGTSGLEVDKTNWANPLDSPPYEAYAVTCGVTFTFGGLHITNDAEVLDIDQRAIPGLFAAGELVGGLFYSNYPGGTGLTSGSVFGRIAGSRAASFAQDKPQ